MSNFPSEIGASSSSGAGLDDNRAFWALRLRHRDIAAIIFGHLQLSFVVAVVLGLVLWFFVVPFYGAIMWAATFGAFAAFATAVHAITAYKNVYIPSTYFDNSPSFDKGGNALLSMRQLIEDHCGEDQKFTVRYTTRFKALRSKFPFVVFDGGDAVLIITPKRFWYDFQNDMPIRSWILEFLRKLSDSGPTTTVEVSGVDLSFAMPAADDTQNLEVTAADAVDYVAWVHPNHEVFESQWEHTTKSGERDYRYKENRTIYSVKAHNISLAGPTGFRLSFGPFNETDQIALANALSLVVAKEYISADEDYNEEQNANDEDAEWAETDDDGGPWDGGDEDCYEILGVEPDASEQEISRASRERLKEYHPDTVQGRGEKIRRLANEETKKIIAARDKALQRLKDNDED